MKINGNSIKPGNIIEHQGKLWRAVKTMHTQPGKGGAYLQVELKDIRTGTKLNERFRPRRRSSACAWTSTNTRILFADGDDYTFMEQETYEQITAQRRADRRAGGVPAGGHGGDGLELRRLADLGLAAGNRDHGAGRGRCRGEGPDRVLLLQAGQARERRARR